MENKKVVFGIAIVVILGAIYLFGGCGGIKYCKVSGCPEEVYRSGEKYCAAHGCSNYSCKNKAVVDFGYCEECIEKAN